MRFRLADVKQLCEEFFRDFPVTEWAKRCPHARKYEEEFLKREGNIDAVVDEFIINLGDDSSGHSSSDESDEFSSDCA
ncbi:hypothetical protein QE152_g13692 [Popillia japonica]|uniref:Uncharacterized protein n=1 Tax=Popillia japonica TaxID=7064 RepID=A0AAW1LCS0_POPJA